MTTKILINVPRLDLPGGVANFYRVLRNYLGFDKQYFEIGATVNETGGVKLVKRALGDYLRFHRRLSTGEYSLVHLNPSLTPKSIPRDVLFLFIARAHAIPVLVFFHGWDNRFQALIAHRLNTLFRYIFSKAAGLVVLAKDFRNQLEAMGVRSSIYQMTTCVDDSLFDVPTRSTESRPEVNILYMSRLDHGKGVVESVMSFAALNRTMPQTTLTIAGDGPERSTAEQFIEKEKLEHVNFLGHVDGDAKLRAFIESDIFFFPTFYGEGLPIVVLEAMAYGLPIITRSVGGLKDFFENERMGFITESTDTVVYAKMLERLTKNPLLCRRMGQYNRRYAQTHFSASAVAKKLENIYVRVCK